MALDPEVQRMLEMAAAAGRPPWQNVGPVAARKEFRETRIVTGGPRPEGVVTRDTSIPGPGGPMAVRLYRPAAESPKALLPALIYLHGGGWVIGDLDTHDSTAARLSLQAGIAVVSVDYRLAPEHPFPAGFDDSVAALAWIGEQGEELGVDPHLLAIGGDSAGANLAAAAALWARDRDMSNLRFQLLTYPVTECVTTSASYARFAEGYGLSRAAMQWFIDLYVPNPADRWDWRAAPLRAASLAGVCPALVITAGFDPLRDEGRAYAARMRDDGATVDYVEFGGMIHGFFGSAALLHGARRGISMAAAALREALVDRAE
ncbi:MAG: alpha/beta hydrolase [Rhodospirillales bacterium]|nr:alpha/beta hydrolase [Rhodospirillales bacterium]